MGTNGLIVPQTPPAVASWMARKRRVVLALPWMSALRDPRGLIAVGMVVTANVSAARPTVSPSSRLSPR